MIRILDRDVFISWWNELLGSWGLSGDFLIYTRTFIILVLAFLISWAVWILSKLILTQIVNSIAFKSKTMWDDYLVKNKFFAALAHLVPMLFMEPMIQTTLYSFPNLAEFFIRLIDLAIILVALITILRFFNTARDVLIEKPALQDKPIESYFQLGKIVVFCILIVLMISVAFAIKPLVILTSMGALTAIIILVFKDTILGFVGSIQLAANDMIRIGDWVTMEKYGADGDVIEINLATVKIQNFDKTITTIPTYSFISDSFKNWRGMLDSDGRRVMRGIHIKIQSVKFCTPELLDKLGEIELIRTYIEEKQKEINHYNDTHVTNKSVLMNGRNQTNLGVFRYYVEQYLLNNKEINNEMTLLVRQLEPTEKGVPIQLYAFTNTQEWANYEAVMADIFDHLLAAVSYFQLEVFEAPAGSDMRQMATMAKQAK